MGSDRGVHNVALMETGDPGTPGATPGEAGNAPETPPGWGAQQPPGAGPVGWSAAPPPPPGYPPNAATGAYWQPGAPPVAPGGLRPRGIGELLDGAFTLYRRNFLLLVAIAAVVQVPLAVLQLLAYQLADVGGRLSSLQDLISSVNTQGFTTSEQQSQIAGDLGAFAAYFGAVFLVQFLVAYPLSLAATTSAVSARYLDQPATVSGSYAAALSRWRPLIAMVLWLVLIVGGAFAASVLLAVLTGSSAVVVLVMLVVFVFAAIVLVRTTVAPQAIVLERKSGWAGLGRSSALTRGSSWRIFGIRLLLWLISSIAAAVITLPVTAAVGGTALGTQQVVGQAAQAVVAVFVAPITLVTLTLLYYDLRIRREGFDIEMLAASL
jgi:hypothetical protein